MLSFPVSSTPGPWSGSPSVSLVFLEMSKIGLLIFGAGSSSPHEKCGIFQQRSFLTTQAVTSFFSINLIGLFQMSIPHHQPKELASALPWRSWSCVWDVTVWQHPRVQIQHGSTLCFWEVLPAGTCLSSLPELAPVLSMWVVIQWPCRECGKHFVHGRPNPWRTVLVAHHHHSSPGSQELSARSRHGGLSLGFFFLICWLEGL